MRVGGLAILLGMAMHIVLNMVVKEFPPDDPTAAQLAEYLQREAGSWAVIHGVRYIAFTCIVLFAAGMFVRTALLRSGYDLGWGIVGLLGAAVFVANGIVTNGVEMLAFMNAPPVTESPDLFWMLFRLSRVLFTAEVVTWSMMILGFSIAGWQARSLPRWISGLGLIQVIAGLLAGVSIVSGLAGSNGALPLEVASIAGLLWFIGAGAYLLFRGDEV